VSATEAWKKCDGGCTPRGSDLGREPCTLPHYKCPGMSPLEIFENIDGNRCNLAHFGGEICIHKDQSFA